jgi:hypothetical protein
MDDRLLCCLTHIISLLNALAGWGYRVSKQKAQLVLSSVTYLGLSLPAATPSPPKRIQNLLQIPLESTKTELLSLLGLFNYFWIWIPNFSLVANLSTKPPKGS